MTRMPSAGRTLVSARGLQTRPMMEKVRAAVFSMIQAQLGGVSSLPSTMRWLDLYAGGVGAFGFLFRIGCLSLHTYAYQVHTCTDISVYHAFLCFVCCFMFSLIHYLCCVTYVSVLLCILCPERTQCHIPVVFFPSIHQKHTHGHLASAQVRGRLGWKPCPVALVRPILWSWTRGWWTAA